MTSEHKVFGRPHKRTELTGRIAHGGAEEKSTSLHNAPVEGPPLRQHPKVHGCGAYISIGGGGGGGITRESIVRSRLDIIDARLRAWLDGSHEAPEFGLRSSVNGSFSA
jgi:hypothetical protein